MQPITINTGPYVIYIPATGILSTDDIHVLVYREDVVVSAVKIWIAQNGGAVPAEIRPPIDHVDLEILCKIVEKNFERIVKVWETLFGQVNYRY